MTLEEPEQCSLRNLPTLIAVFCKICGHLSYPYQDWGCQNCGADGKHLERKSILAEGQILGIINLISGSEDTVADQNSIASIRLNRGPILHGTIRSRGPAWPGEQVIGLSDTPKAEHTKTAKLYPAFALKRWQR